MTPVKELMKPMTDEDREILECMQPRSPRTVVKGDVEKRKNKTRNMPCPLCDSGKKFKKCCW